MGWRRLIGLEEKSEVSGATLAAALAKAVPHKTPLEEALTVRKMHYSKIVPDLGKGRYIIHADAAFGPMLEMLGLKKHRENKPGHFTAVSDRTIDLPGADTRKRASEKEEDVTYTISAKALHQALKLPPPQIEPQQGKT